MLLSDMLSDIKSKYLKPLLFLILISAIFFSLYIGNTFVWADDLLFHMYRLVGDFHSILDHQLLPRLYPYANNGYGYGTPLFYCDLFILPFSLLLKTQLSLVTIYQIMVVFYGFLTSLICFWVVLKISKKRYTPYLITIIYTFAAYRLYDIYSRAAFGEILAFTFMPLVFLGVYEVLVLHKKSYILLASGVALLLLSHTISFILVIPLLFLSYVVFLIYNRHNLMVIIKVTKTLMVSVFLALGLTSFHWLSMLEQYFSQDFIVKHLSDYYRVDTYHLNILAQLKPFLKHFKTGSGEIFNVISLGINCLLVPLLGLRKRQKYTYYFLIISGYLFLLLGLGLLPFYAHPALTFLQFPFRYFIIAYPALTFASIFVLDELAPKATKLVAVAIIVLASIEFLSFALTFIKADYRFNKPTKHDELYQISKDSKYDYNVYQLSGAEYLPLPNVNDFIHETYAIRKVRPDKDYEDLVFDFKHHFSAITFTYDFKEDTTIMFPLSYYKGYKVYEIVEGKKKEVFSFRETKYNKLAFIARKGVRTYMCHYEGTLLQKVGLGISVFTLIAISILMEKNKHLFIITRKGEKLCK